jgi:hypothetical protein
MPEFRKWILALAGVAVFTGLASAQVGTPTGGAPGTAAGTALTCSTTNGAVTPTVRAEGYTELVGDILIVCTGGSAPATGTTIPTANFTIFLNTAVTSRLLSSSVTAGAGTVSEALLLVDEPGSALTGYGPSLPLTYCTTTGGSALTPLTSAAVGAGPGGCVQTVGTVGANSGVPVNAGGTAGANAFQGVVTGNQVSFYGIPMLPPTTAGLERVYRITNIRANANGVTAGGPTPGSITASISINGSTAATITASTLTVGFVQQGLSSTNTALRNPTNTGGGGATFNQCNSVSVTSTSSSTTASGGLLEFQENFATAFKTRTTIANGGSVIGGTVVTQNIPGNIYNSESGFVEANFPTGISNGNTGAAIIPGLADFGTRLKAVFSNVPSGVSIYVSTRDLTNSYTTGAQAANAVLVVSETAPDSAGTGAITLPQATQTGTYVGTGPSGAVVPGIAPVTPLSAAGTSEAVWEVVYSNPSAIDTLLFGVYINYTASPSTNSPSAPSNFTVTLSFAPTPSGGGFTATNGAAASSTLPIPRFSDSLDVTKTYGTFALCTTSLLYPYVVNVLGFDTGIAIANTSTDTFGTSPQQGTCTLNFYGSTAPSAAFTSANVATGTVYSTLASTVAPGFAGYMIATCNFQYAHGFAFVSDVGARNLAMGYLALVIVPSSSGGRTGSLPENLNN